MTNTVNYSLIDFEDKHHIVKHDNVDYLKDSEQ